ncbi:hypothetical protein OIO90_003949 [Microbotryomycetes sp. JL221]|nr:hypothetical protein OIO90_003949 [Microbotryomycetes sp. JL221]
MSTILPKVDAHEALTSDDFDHINKATNNLSISYRVTVGLYGLWGCMWLIVYLPAAIKLLIVLVKRINHLKRSLGSLHFVSSLVNEGYTVDTSRGPVGEQAQVRSMLTRCTDSFHWPTSKQSADSGVIFKTALRSSSPPELVITVPSPSLGVEDPFTSPVVKKFKKPTRTRRHVKFEMDQHKSQERGHTEIRIRELQFEKMKAKRHLMVVSVQLALTLLTLGSYLPLCFLVVTAASPVRDRQLTLIWISATFVIPGTISSFVFCLFSCKSLTKDQVSELSSSESPPSTPCSPTSPDLLLSPQTQRRAMGDLRRARSNDEFQTRRAQSDAIASRQQTAESTLKFSGLLINSVPDLTDSVITQQEAPLSKDEVTIDIQTPPRASIAPRSRPETIESLIDPQITNSTCSKPIKCQPAKTFDAGLKDLTALVAQELYAKRLRKKS